MTPQDPAAEQVAAQFGSPGLNAASVLAATVEKEKARKDTDLELIESLESTILRADAPDSVWEQTVAAIKKLALSRAKSRMENS